MTDIATISDGRAPVSRPPTDKAENVRKSLQHIRRHLLAPFDAWEQAKQAGADIRAGLLYRPKFLIPEVLQPDHPKTEEERTGLLARHDRALGGQPSRLAMVAMRETLLEAVEGKPNARQNRVIAGLMVGAFPNVRPYSPETYMETLIEALDQTGMPPSAVAKACNEIVRTSTFPPTVAEVAGKASEVHGELRSAIWSIDHFFELIEWAAVVRTWIASVELLKPDCGNRERPPEPPRRWVGSGSGRQQWC